MKTSELSGPALDKAVADARNVSVKYDENEGWCISNFFGWFPFRPTTAWAQGGPIIEDEGITIDKHPNGEWVAESWDENGNAIVSAEGPTILIAAMKCFVYTKEVQCNSQIER